MDDDEPLYQWEGKLLDYEELRDEILPAKWGTLTSEEEEFMGESGFSECLQRAVDAGLIECVLARDAGSFAPSSKTPAFDFGAYIDAYLAEQWEGVEPVETDGED